jgi:hypothetical protein
MRLHCFSIVGITGRLPSDAKVQLIEAGPQCCFDTFEAEEQCLDLARLVGLARLVKCWCWSYINTRCPKRGTVRTRVQHQHWYEDKHQQVSYWITSRLVNEAGFTKKAVSIAFTLRAIVHGPCTQ